MNAETLHAIAIAIRDDVAASRSRELLRQLTEALSSQVDAPQEPSFQQQVSNTLTELRQNLQAAPANDFSPLWRDYLGELGIEDLLGDRLRAQLDEIFARNQITVSVARDEVKILFERVESLFSAITQIIEGFSWLGIRADVLEPGESVVAAIIPRLFVHNELRALGKEFEELAKDLSPIAELATGSRPTFEVREISSSDFGVVIEAAPEIVKAIGVAVSGILLAYARVKRIRGVQEAQAAAGLPPEVLALTEEFATEQMEKAVEEIADKLLDDNRTNLQGEGRIHEVEFELKRSFRSIMYRIDHGMRITVRASPPRIQTVPKVEGDESPEELTPEMQTYLEITEAAKQLEMAELDGVPILSLPAPTDEEDGNEDENDTGTPS